MLVDDDHIQILAEKNPKDLPWNELDIDIVFECTGIFTSKEKCLSHLQAGAKKVIISAPGDRDIDATIVYGVNENILRSSMNVISNASCTTNCLAPVAKVLNDAIGIKEGLMTTIHAYTNDQSTVDSYHTDLHRARAAAQNMIPTKTGAAAAVGLVLPELKGRLDGFAIRVPVINVSVVDLTLNVARKTSIEEVNEVLKLASERKLNSILSYNSLPLVSSDFNHSSYPSIFDATQTRVIGSMVKILSWYDNEWGFSNQMLRTTKAWFEAS
jgi:glyceraldehyde 3-phosphate dehydrogenase